MEQQDGFYKDVLDNLYDPVYFVNRDLVITYWNRSAERFTGYTSEDVIGMQCSDNILVHVDENGHRLCKNGCPLLLAMSEGAMHEQDVFVHHKNGHRLPVSMRVAPIRDAHNNVVGAVEIFADRSSKLAALNRAAELERVALMCPVTGAGNRRFSEMTLKESLDEFQRYDWSFGLIMIDVDRFDEVAAHLGQHAGEDVMRMVARTTESNLRSFDYLGRWEGACFLLLVPRIELDALTSMARRFCALIANGFFGVGFENVEITVSAGATLAQKEDTVESLVVRAEKALARSRHEGGNRATIA